MRLRRLNLTRYGKFTDDAIDFGAARPGTPDLHIVYGLNEAGKSTALSAYLDLLFGIEHNSRYGFLHPYPSMQVGGQLEFSGAEHELVRVKTRANSLLDGRGQPVPEAVLSVPLAGLTRDTYRSMFSLDDQTLEDGGNAIIASKGELGELLFAASAGLADLGTTLAKVREEADEIHKLRGRTTQIAELKRELAQLKADREAVDTLASTHAALVAALEQAETAYAEAMRNQAVAKARHDEIARVQRAAPLAAELARLTGEIAQFGALPAPPAEWAEQLPGLMIKNAELQKQIEGTQADIARLDAEVAGLVVDGPVLALGERITGLANGMARFSTAADDLPRRLAAIVEDAATITAILVRLGQAGHASPDALLLPAPVVGTLRELIEARSGIDTKVQTAQRELAQARDAIERTTNQLESGGNEATSIVTLEGVDAALAALRRGDHQARMRLAERALPQMSRRYTPLRDALAPWAGDGDDLRAVALPDARHLDGWRMRANALDRRRAEHDEKRRELVTRQREDEARLVAIRAAAGTIDDAEAIRLRALRDAAWAAHAKTLDASSAATFSAALQADDTLGASRLAHVQDLAELRTLVQGLAVTEASRLRQEELLAEVDRELVVLADEVRAAVENAIVLPKSASVASWLDHIESWARRRTEALAAWDAMQETEGDFAAAKADLDRDVAALAEAMSLAGFENIEDLSPAALMQAADTALSQGGAQQATRAAAEKALREREGDLLIRQRALADAKAEAGDWQERWADALSATWFTDDGVGAVRELLSALGELPAALSQRNARARQIETMERDQEAFAEDLGAILSELGETLDPQRILETARSLSRRHEMAEQDRRLMQQKLREQTRLAEILRALMQDLAVHSARKAEMTALFGVDTLQEVSVHMERVAEQRRLRRQIETLGQQIASELRAVSVEAALAQLNAIDLGETEREAAEMTARLDDLETLSRQRFADQARASERLQAIGGDDAVARIEAQRRTVLLQIEDRAMDYLRLKTGALMAEKALRAYREKHRSSMMNRASDAFALITRNEYSGLAARPEKDRETLIGLPRLGGSKLASDMSKGTQFQLYLALRLAGYQEFARSRPAVPFIADDIMETFDEPRSEEVFRLLGEMANIGQVIYLTHHRHLCDIARAVVPAARVHELGA